MGRDGREDVITGKKCTAFRINQTEVIGRMARCVNCKPVSIAETNGLVMS